MAKGSDLIRLRDGQVSTLAEHLDAGRMAVEAVKKPADTAQGFRWQYIAVSSDGACVSIGRTLYESRAGLAVAVRRST